MFIDSVGVDVDVLMTCRLCDFGDRGRPSDDDVDDDHDDDDFHFV